MGHPEKPTPEELVKLYGASADVYRPERPQHRVLISQPFWFGKFEVTQEQWQAVTGKNPSKFKGAKNPVEMVSWHDVQSFLQGLRAKSRKPFRLPTEAEWEYACRAGAATQYGFGDERERLSDHAWWVRNSEYRTHPVGSKRSNRWGLHDTHGNVWEWCQDGYVDYAAGAQTDPTGPNDADRRVVRGGSRTCSEFDCRSAFRGGWHATLGNYSNGFRVARSLEPRGPAAARKPPTKPKPEPLPPADAEGWISLFDGKTLSGWSIVNKGRFALHGAVRVQDGRITLDAGRPITAIAWAGEFPHSGYEIEFEAMRLSGDADFGTLVFPVGKEYCKLLVPGTFERVVGLQNVDGSVVEGRLEGRRIDLKNGQWHRVRLRTTDVRIEAYLDGEKVIGIERAGHEFSVVDIYSNLGPLVIHSWESTAALRNIRLRLLNPAP
jgi:hypothetical protein